MEYKNVKILGYSSHEVLLFLGGEEEGDGELVHGGAERGAEAEKGGEGEERGDGGE